MDRFFLRNTERKYLKIDFVNTKDEATDFETELGKLNKFKQFIFLRFIKWMFGVDFVIARDIFFQTKLLTLADIDNMTIGSDNNNTESKN